MYRQHIVDDNMAPDRTDLFTVRMAPDELTMLRQLAEEDGVTASDFVRLFIRRAYAERHGATKKKKH